jgi:hypothetical protein
LSKDAKTIEAQSSRTAKVRHFAIRFSIVAYGNTTIGFDWRGRFTYGRWPKPGMPVDLKAKLGFARINNYDRHR